MEIIRQVLDYSWQPESTLITVMVLVLGLVLGRLLPASRHKVWGSLFLFVLSLTGQFAAGVFDMMELKTAASFFHEAFVVVGGVIVIRLWAMMIFRIVLPLLRFEPPQILEDIVVIIGFIAWGLVRMRYAGADLSGIIATSAVITAVIGFSMQDTLGNILGGLAIQLDNSIELGDWIKVDDVSGRIVDISWRSTLIETRNWETVVIPNSVLMKSKIVVQGRRSGAPLQWRRQVAVNVDLGTPPARVIPVIEAAVREAEISNVAIDPAPSCVLMDFEHGYGRYFLRYWLSDMAQDDGTDSLVRTHIYTALQRHGMRIAIGEHNVRLTQLDDQHQAAIQSRETARRVGALKRVDLFSSFSEAEVHAVAISMAYTPFAKGDVITRQGNVAHWLYILAAGDADVLVDVTGQPGRHKVSTLHGPCYFGEMGLLTGDPRTATIIATTDVECYRLDKAAFQDIVGARPAIADELARQMSARLTELKANADAQAQAGIADDVQSQLLRRMKRFFGID